MKEAVVSLTVESPLEFYLKIYDIWYRIALAVKIPVEVTVLRPDEGESLIADGVVRVCGDG